MIKILLAGLLMLLLCSPPVMSYGQSVPEQPAPAASISGTVLDVNGGVVLGAQVTLVASDGSANRTVMSDDAGQFSFSWTGSRKVQVHGCFDWFRALRLFRDRLVHRREIDIA